MTKYVEFTSKYTSNPLRVSQSKSKSIFQLPIEQQVLVPSTTRASHVMRKKLQHKRVKQVQDYLSKLFGGYTSSKATGGYYSSDKNQVIREPVTVVTSFASQEGFEKKQPQLLKQLSKWRRNWKQESMGYEFEGDLYYIGKQERKKRELKRRLKER